MSADDLIATPARLNIGRAGARYTTASMLKFRADHARAVDAVMTEVSADWPRKNGLPEFHSEVATRDEYLRHPERGRRLRVDEIAKLKALNRASPKKDALGSRRFWFSWAMDCHPAAVEASAARIAARADKCAARKRASLETDFRFATRASESRIISARLSAPRSFVWIVGERPGLATAESLSAYVIYRLRLRSLESDRTVISNIHRKAAFQLARHRRKSPR